MPRRYRHIKEYEKEIYELKEKGLTNREIADKFGFELEQVKGLIKRHNANQRKLEAGIAEYIYGLKARMFITIRKQFCV